MSGGDKATPLEPLRAITGAQMRAASLTTARAAIAGGWEGVLGEVLSALGLAPTVGGGSYGATGKRETRTSRLATAAATVRTVAWEAYEACRTCGRDAGAPCRALRSRDTSITWPHPGRKQRKP